MVLLHGTDAVQQLSENVLLYDLAQMRGTDALLSRVPQNLTGVYAWYRRFELNPSARHEPEVFVAAILDELCKAHCAPRETRLPPSHRVVLKAETVFSKQALLEKLAANSSFRELMFILLDNSLLFQQPLYIGKASNIYTRVRSHLGESSDLRIRLKTAGHELDRCKLLVIGTSYSVLNFVSEDTDDNESNQEFPEAETDQLVEDILSRLFLPSFTLRYG